MNANKALIALIAALVLHTTATLAVVFTSNTTIAIGVTTYDGQDIVVSNCTLTVNGPHSFASLQVISNAVLAHSAAPNGEAGNLLSLAISGNLGLDSSSEIDVSGLGYAADAGPGAGTNYSQGCGSGAGHGGMGGSPLFGGVGTVGGVYDSVLTPSLWGSGGGVGESVGGAGGGAVCLVVAGTLQVDGVIAADGISPSGWSAGGGAGGSIQISAGTLAGGGSISAQGGSNTGGGGGGGGRIALYLTQNTFGGTITAAGGLGFQNGGAGTIYTKLAAGAYGQVLVDNGTNAGVTGLDSGFWPAGTVFDLTISGGAIVKPDAPLTFRNLVLTNGLLACVAGQSNLTLTVLSNLTVAAGARIDVSGLGYAAGAGPGAGTEYSGWSGSGAGHGGTGGLPEGGGGGGGVYDSVLTPSLWGSGGGASDESAGAAGGGAIRLAVAGTLQVDGVIAADGMSPGNIAGGGAGGSIQISAGTLAGGGSISAQGASGGNGGGGGGGGGRIALYLPQNTFGGTITAAGGLGFQNGGAGTIYTKLASDAYGQVLVDNGTNAGMTGLDSGFWPAGTVFDLTISGGAIVKSDAPLTFRNLVLTNGLLLGVTGQSNLTLTVLGNLTVAAGSTLSVPSCARSVLTVLGNLTVAAGGRIDVSGLGYGAGAGPGAGMEYLPNGCGSGAGHGGTGGSSLWGGGGDSVCYDSVLTPSLWGSGGGNGYRAGGGAGGGAICLVVAGTLQLDGVIAADGVSPNWSGGGGAGGSIQINAGTLAGSGSISAQGGTAVSSGGGGGGGGRIALYLTQNTFAGTITADGGLGFQNGGAGTIYTKLAAGAYGQVLVDNGTNAGVTGLDSGFWPAGTVFDLTISGGAIVKPDAPLTFRNLVLTNNSLLSCVTGQSNLTLTVLGNLTVAGGGRIDVSGLGYGAGAGPGAGTDYSASDGCGSGAGHGGTGGSSLWGGGGDSVCYDSVLTPSLWGSGGGNGYRAGGGAGGGAICLVVAGTLQLDGVIAADGVSPNWSGGGGAGGSIQINAGTLAGSGLISAQGGSAVSAGGGGGGGGCIALYLTQNTFGGTGGIITVAGGLGFQNGYAGSYYTSTTYVAPMVIAQSPSGQLNRFVSYMDVTFNQPVDPGTFTNTDLVLTTPSGSIPASQITLASGDGLTWRIGFPTQTANGGYSLTVGPHVANLFGQEMAASYSGGFTVNFTTPTTTVSQTGGNLSLIWSSATGLSYQLQSATNLPAASWLNEGAPINGTGGLLTNSLPFGVQPRKFFRLLLLEN